MLNHGETKIDWSHFKCKYRDPLCRPQNNIVLLYDLYTRAIHKHIYSLIALALRLHKEHSRDREDVYKIESNFNHMFGFCIYMNAS